MTRYVALLRGIGPGDPRMRNENLRAVCRDLGFRDVSTVISSGNVVFEAGQIAAPEIETALEAAWPRELGFESTTIVRSREELADLVEMRPFGSLEHGPRSYLLVTFSKRALTDIDDLHRFDVGRPLASDGDPATESRRPPLRPIGPHVLVLGATDREVFSVTDTTADATPNVMSWVEGRFGRDVSSRTWLTVTRILRKMG